MIETSDSQVGIIPTEEPVTKSGKRQSDVHKKKWPLSPGEILEKFYRRPWWFYRQKESPGTGFLPAVVSFLGSQRLRFLYTILVLNVILYAKIYTGKYQLHFGIHVMQMLYVFFGSLAISSLWFLLKPWKVVGWTLGVLGGLSLIPYSGLPFITGPVKETMTDFLFGTSFDPFDLLFYALGGAISWLILTVLTPKLESPCVEESRPG